MSTTAPPPPKNPRRTKNAKLKGAGAIAQGKKAKAAGKRGVVVDGPVGGNITTGTTYQTIIHQAAEPGASAGDLRRAYLAWVSARANELPLLAGESGAPVQLSSVYTALLTRRTERRRGAEARGGPRRARYGRPRRRSAVGLGGAGQGPVSGVKALSAKYVYKCDRTR